jgi:hypothetical protein
MSDDNNDDDDMDHGSFLPRSSSTEYRGTFHQDDDAAHKQQHIMTAVYGVVNINNV